jgi:hypothetical protein
MEENFSIPLANSLFSIISYKNIIVNIKEIKLVRLIG